MRFARALLVSTILCSCASSVEFRPTKVTPQQLFAHDETPQTGCRPDATYHFRYRTTSNYGDVFVTDVYEVKRPNGRVDFRRETNERGVSTEDGRTGNTAWKRTANGLVLGDSPAVDAFTRVLDGARRKPDRRVRMLGITVSTPARYVIEITPDKNIWERRYYDVRTMRLRTITTEDYDRNVVVNVLSDYKILCGRDSATHIIRSSSLSPQVLDVRLVAHARLPTAVALAIPKSKTPFVPQYRLPMTLNSMFDDKSILIRMDIGGTPYWVKLDSGAGMIALDRDLIQRLGGREFGRIDLSKGGRVEASTAVLPRVDIGPVYATNLVVNVLRHDYVEQGVHIVGLLGCDFIGSRPLQIDFQKQTVTLLKKPPSLSDRSWMVIRTPLQGCQPLVPVRYENQTATLVLDTGSPDTIVNRDVLDRIGGSPLSLGETVVRYVGGQLLSATQYGILNANIGRLPIDPAVIAVVNSGRGQALDSSGLLGLDTLRRFRMVLDYRNGRTFLARR